MEISCNYFILVINVLKFFLPCLNKVLLYCIVLYFVPLPSNFSHSIARNIETPITVTRDSIYLKLSRLKPKKAQDPDGIPSWLLKENADLLTGPITDIINCSYREGCLPTSWKKADMGGKNIFLSGTVDLKL